MDLVTGADLTWGQWGQPPPLGFRQKFTGEDEAIAIGIDLGTKYSCVAAWIQQHEKIEIIPNEQGNFTTPSCVAFNGEECLIGESANNQRTMNPGNTIYDVKRLIGRKFSDVTVQEEMKSWPFKVIKGVEKKPTVVVTYKGERREFVPEQISALVLTKMKEIAEDYFAKPVEKAVITVPAYFNYSQRQATRDACAIAGLDVLQLLNEPAAAAIAYGLNDVESRESRRGKKVVVFDLGGRTFDISVLNLTMDGNFQVIAVGGDNHLGGVDFDNNLLHYLVQEFKRKHNKDMSGYARAMGRLRTHCEKAKQELSSALQATVSVDCLYMGIDFDTKVTRHQFEDLNKDLFNRCIECMKVCLSEANMHKDNVDKVVLVGGSTRIPKVQKLLEQFFGGKKLCKTINPEEAVAHGAAALAVKLTGQGTDMRQLFSLADVIPVSLGMKLIGDRMSVVIPRNTCIPTKKQYRYWTCHDNQSSMRFTVYEGENKKASENTYLGGFLLHGLPLAPKGEVRVKVRFEIDASGILHVTAEEVTTGQSGSITIKEYRGRSSYDDIQEMRETIELLQLENQKLRKSLSRSTSSSSSSSSSSSLESVYLDARDD